MLLIGVFAAIRRIVITEVKAVIIASFQDEAPAHRPQPKCPAFPWRVLVVHRRELLLEKIRKIHILHVKGVAQHGFLALEAAVNVRLVQARVRSDCLCCRLVQTFPRHNADRTLDKRLFRISTFSHRTSFFCRAQCKCQISAYYHSGQQKANHFIAANDLLVHRQSFRRVCHSTEWIIPQFSLAL